MESVGINSIYIHNDHIPTKQTNDIYCYGHVLALELSVRRYWSMFVAGASDEL